MRAADARIKSASAQGVSHLRYSGLSFEQQSAALADIVRADVLLWSALERAREARLPDWLIVSGAIYNTVWNHLSGRVSGHGIRDIDLFYHDASDLSWEAEDAVIRQNMARFGELTIPVEIRNQARVHLWYEQKFGLPCPAYRSSAHALDHFVAKTQSVGVALSDDDHLVIMAPFGLDPIFSFRFEPNRVRDLRRHYEAKGAQAGGLWPEVTIEPW